MFSEMSKNHLVRIILRDDFDFVEHQDRAFYGLRYKLTLTRSNDNAVLNKAPGIANAKINISNLDWYVPYYTLSISQEVFLRNT